MDHVTRRRPLCRIIRRWVAIATLGLVVPAVICTYLIISPQDVRSSPGDQLGPFRLATVPMQDYQHIAPTSVMVYFKSITDKKYGWLAHRIGKIDLTVNSTSYDQRKNWWENPPIVYEETPVANPDTTGGADCEVIKGHGTSSNIELWVRLIGHADVAVKTTPQCDCMKGAITATTTASHSYHDGDWTEVVSVKDKLLTFRFDTCDKSKILEALGADNRTIPISFERYTRGKRKWEPKSTWPATPERGDVKTVFYATDAQLEITGYHYGEQSSTAP